MSQILIVDNEAGSRNNLRRLLERHDFQVSEASTVEEARQQFTLDELDLIIAELRLSDAPGTALIPITPTPVLIMTSYASQQASSDSPQTEAIDYIARPFDPDIMISQVQRMMKDGEQKAANLARRSPRSSEQAVSGMLGDSPQMMEMFRRIRKVAQTNSSVLIQGESGTGKELVARALHESSPRNSANLISVNCAAIPDSLIESELFGHEKGAFAGATSTRSGLVEAANNGTLFLDEIGELPADAQARLLRVLQENEIRKVGSVQSQQVDIRLVAATQQDLKQLVDEGQFREDLYYRINVIPLYIPPLRERGTDILLIAELFLERACERIDIEAMRLSADAIQVVTTYPWPGNVRELQNAIERAVILCEDEEIPADLLGLDVTLVKIDAPSASRQNGAVERRDSHENEEIKDDPPEDLSLEDYFQRFVLEHQDHMNETELAKKLGISRKCLWERRQRFDIPRKKKSS